MVRPLALALLLVLAGCPGIAGLDRGTPDEASPRATATPTAAPTPTDATAANTIEYADLTEAQRRAFDEALANGSAGFATESIRESPYVEEEYFAMDDFERFRSVEFVRKNGTYYRVSLRFGRLIADYGLRATEADPHENATVVPFGNLSESTREPVRWAIENGSYRTRPGRWYSFPEALGEADYVRYDGSYYEISAIVGDYRIQELTVEEA